MLLIRDITRADYPVVDELLGSNDLGVGGGYSPVGQEVVVAELHGSVVGIAEFQLDCNFGLDKGRPDHPGEQAWILTMAVADAHHRQGGSRPRHRDRPPGPGRRPHLAGPGPPGRRR